MPEFQVLATPEDVARAAADQIVAALNGAARTLVLAGGNTPKRCYELLAGAEVKWGRVTVLFGDERCVPPGHPDSNYHMARESLLGRVAPATVHRIAGELGPDEAAAAYDRIIGALTPLDVVLLGAGEDGHTASLFPGHPEVQAKGWAVGVRNAPKPPPDRVSLSPPAPARQMRLPGQGAARCHPA